MGGEGGKKGGTSIFTLRKKSVTCRARQRGCEGRESQGREEEFFFLRKGENCLPPAAGKVIQASNRGKKPGCYQG